MSDDDTAGLVVRLSTEMGKYDPDTLGDDPHEFDSWNLLFDVKAALESRPLTADREAVETVVGRVLWNAANFPERAQPGMLGANIMPLTNLVTDAVMAVLRPVADAQAEAWDEGHNQAVVSIVWPKKYTSNPYRTPASPEEGKD